MYTGAGEKFISCILYFFKSWSSIQEVRNLSICSSFGAEVMNIKASVSEDYVTRQYFI